MVYCSIICWHTLTVVLSVLPKVIIWMLGCLSASSWSFCRSRTHNVSNIYSQKSSSRIMATSGGGCYHWTLLHWYTFTHYSGASTWCRPGLTLLQPGCKHYRRYIYGVLALRVTLLLLGDGVYLRALGVSGRGYNLARWEASTRQCIDDMQPESAAGSRYQHRAAVFEIHDTTHP